LRCAQVQKSWASSQIYKWFLLLNNAESLRSGDSSICQSWGRCAGAFRRIANSETRVVARYQATRSLSHLVWIPRVAPELSGEVLADLEAALTSTLSIGIWFSSFGAPAASDDRAAISRPFNRTHIRSRLFPSPALRERLPSSLRAQLSVRSCHLGLVLAPTKSVKARGFVVAY
jgi:hypothetical protein